MHLQGTFALRCDDHVDRLLSSIHQALLAKYMAVLDATMTKLGRYDEGSLIGSILSFTVSIFMSFSIIVYSKVQCLSCKEKHFLFKTIKKKQNVASTGKEVGQVYVLFVRNNMDQLRSKVIDEFFLLNFYERWYAEQMNVICNWLSDRVGHGLHYHQVTCLSHMLKVSFIFQTKRIRKSNCFLMFSWSFTKFTESLFRFRATRCT